MAMIAPAALLVGILFLMPIGRLFGMSLDYPNWTTVHFEDLFSSTVYVKSLWATIRVSGFVVLGCLAIGYPIGYVLATCRPKLRPYLALTVLLPFWTSILVRNFAWMYLLQRRGTVNDLLQSIGLTDQPLQLMFNEFGVVLGMTNALLPFMVLPIYVAIQSQDEAFLEAAESLGAGPSMAFLKVTLPLSLPGIYAGALLVFATALGFFVTPALLGGGKVLVAATYITHEVETLLNWQGAAAASIVLLAIILIVIAAYMRVVSVERLSGAGDVTA